MTSHLTCPYRSVPDDQRWDRSFSAVQRQSVDPYAMRKPKFQFDKSSAVATFGSCFAQNISKRLTANSYNFVRAEYDSRLTTDENSQRGNDLFSARYGNIYTAKHFEQLYNRAFGTWSPRDSFWTNESGRYIDPCRPSVDPNGFPDLPALEAARNLHLAAVRSVFETAEILVLTLGLTEAWVNADDGMSYPICPGCGYGVFDAKRHVFKNYSIEEVVTSLNSALDGIFVRNPNLKVILTVSPVPLAATMEERHVLSSTVYSKSVLRVAAELVSSNRENVDYFASYEIVNWGREMSSYFEGDLRTVAESGIDHVMRVFFRHYCGHEIGLDIRPKSRTWCDEDLMIGDETERGATSQSVASTSAKTKILADPEPESVESRILQNAALRHPSPFTVWKPAPYGVVKFGRKLDSLGYYNSREIAEFMGDDYKRVCVVGSSFVMDITLDHDQTVTGALQRRFDSRGHRNVFVYNCGISGSVSSQDLSNLIHHVADFNPSVVVVISGSNDVANAISGDPRPGHPPLFAFWEQIILRKLTRSDLPINNSKEYLDTLRKTVGFSSPKWLSALFANGRRNLEKMGAFAHGRNFGCLLVNPPTKFGHRMDAKPFASGTATLTSYDDVMKADAYQRALYFNNQLSKLHQLNVISSLDLTEIFDDAPPSHFVDAKHLTAGGYDQVAGRIFEQLVAGFPSVFATPVTR